MDVKVLLFNIYTLYLLHPIMATHQRLCGSNLVDALRFTCAGRGYYNEAINPPTISKKLASSFLTTEGHPRRIRRGIVNECCLKECSRDVLESYCMPRVTTTQPTASTATPPTTSRTTPRTTLRTTPRPRHRATPTNRPTARPTTTLQLITSPRPPVRENVLRDYESSNNEGPLTSGEPTPTENRTIINGTELRQPFNESVDVPTRTANNSRDEGAIQDSSDQDSIDENSESEAPTSGTRKKTKKPRTRPPKKNKNQRRKHKERNRIRNVSKTKHRGDSSRESSRETTRNEQSNGSEQSRDNRGKVNESQRRQSERNPSGGGNGGGTEIDRLKQKIIDTLSNVELSRQLNVNPVRPPTVPQRFN